MHWLSFGGGVNSMALAILLHQGKVEGVTDWAAIFADTGNEKDATYEYVKNWAIPWFKEVGVPFVTVSPPETVLERWQRLNVTGSRTLRTCTAHAKIRPINRFLKNGNEGIQIVGIDAGEAHRARAADKRYPLVELDIDRDGCAEIIAGAGLPVPEKSGCWMCPFMRVGEVLALAKNEPEKFEIIAALEEASKIAHPVDPGKDRAQWHNKPCKYWRDRAHLEESQLDLGFIYEPEPPCGCYDG